jgi:hypothetical protein
VLWCGELCHGRGKAVVMGITTSKPSMSQLSGRLRNNPLDRKPA